MNILFLDDDPTALSFLQQAGTLEGNHTVDIAKSAEDALGQVVTTQYDLITVDINLPGASGLEILSLLRNMCPHALIVIISGFIPENLPNGLTSCIDGTFQKPISLRTVQKIIQCAKNINTSLTTIQTLSAKAETEVIPLGTMS